MKDKIKSNSGFTLIELIIAMAILAFMMTAVCAFMSSSVATYKKSKADITVHNSAQETYDQITDSIMQATDIYVLGYIAPSGDDVLDFEISDRDVQDSNIDLTYFVKDSEHETILKNMAEYKPGYPIVYFDAIPNGASIYVEQLIIENSVPIDTSMMPTYTAGTTDYTNNLTAETVKIVQAVSVDPVTMVSTPVVTATGAPVYTVNDTVRNIYTFDKDNLYLERKYAFMTALNDFYDSTDANDKMLNYMYSSSFSYLKFAGGDTVSGCTIVIDEDNSSIGVDLNFSDKNMTYTTLGMVNVRNSYVLKAKK